MLVILDPSLQSYDGHFLTYDKAIADVAARRGERCVVFAAKNAVRTMAGDLRVVPCFRYALEADVDDQVVARAFLSDLEQAARSTAFEPNTVLFLHTATHRQIVPAVQALELNRFKGCTLVILLRYSPAPSPFFPNSDTVLKYRNALESIKRLGMGDRVRLVTDSELLADEYGAITDLPVEIVPIPHAGDMHPQSGPSSPLRLVYLGNARSTKGFQYLPYLVSHIRPYLTSGAWAAEFQANVMFRRDLESVMALCALREEPVTLWENELSLEAYEELLDRASLIVLPYQTLFYHSQSSGVFAEAIGRGKPVVVPRGTWMARQISASGAGMLFAPGDRADFAGTVKDAMSKIVELTNRARALQPSWIKRHNAEDFVDCLLQRSATP